MLNFCTLFNKNYFSRGIALYESLSQHCKEFHLYIFAFDDITYETLLQLKLSNVTPISLQDFEDEQLLEAKKSRTAGEYCWTCTSSTILYSINRFHLDHCIYLDADLFFFSDPAILIKEAEGKSVIITKHRYTPKYDQSSISGTYCVQFMYFKADANGMQVLEWWRDKCIEWCHAWVEPGRFGDQYYLEDWTTRFEGVHVMEHLGGGLAPWNIQQYHFYNNDGKIVGYEIEGGNAFEPVFFHFHHLKFLQGYVQLTAESYDLTDEVKLLIFTPYLKTLNALKINLKLDSKFDIHGTSTKSSRFIYSYKKLLKCYMKDVLLAFRLFLGIDLFEKIRKLQHIQKTEQSGRNY